MAIFMHWEFDIPIIGPKSMSKEDKEEFIEDLFEAVFGYPMWKEASNERNKDNHS